MGPEMSDLIFCLLRGCGLDKRRLLPKLPFWVKTKWYEQRRTLTDSPVIVTEPINVGSDGSHSGTEGAFVFYRLVRTLALSCHNCFSTQSGF